MPTVRHLMGDDQMMLGVHRDLHIVADDAGAAAAGRHRAGCRDRSARSAGRARPASAPREPSSLLHLLLQLGELLLQTRSSWLRAPPIGSCRSAVSSWLQIARHALLDLRRRRSILARVKFLSRLFTALNLLPSIATLAFVSRPISRHSSTNRAQTLRMAPAVVLAEVGDRLVVGHKPAQSATSPRHCARPRAPAAGSTEPD